MLLLLGESNWDCIVKNGQKGVENLKKDLDLKGFGFVQWIQNGGVVALFVLILKKTI